MEAATLSKKEKVSFVFKGKKFNLYAKNCSGINRVLGLMFKSKHTGALVFKFGKPTNLRIHSLFVFFPFVAVWFNKKGKVVYVKRVKPFTFSISPRKSYSSLLEIPINFKYMKKTKFLVGD